jgi:hypothetical protein
MPLPSFAALTDRVLVRWPLIALVGLLLFCSWMNVRAIEADSIPPVADGSSYYSMARELARALTRWDFHQTTTILYESHVRPPLVQLVVSTILSFSPTPTIQLARHCMLLFLWLLLLSTYGLGARLQDRSTGLVAAIFLACFPQVIGFSRIYWLDLPLAAMTTLCLWSLLCTDHFQRRIWSGVFGITLGLGMLTKLTFPCFIAGPLVYLLLIGWTHPSLPNNRFRFFFWTSQRKTLLLNSLFALIVALLVAAPWYLPQLGKVWHNFQYNQHSLLLPNRTFWSLDSALIYLRFLYEHQLGSFFTLWLVLALPFFLRFSSSTHRWFLLSWFLLPYFFFSFVMLGVHWSRLTLPYLPALSLIIALPLLHFRFSFFCRALSGAACLIALTYYLLLNSAPWPQVRGSFPWDRVLAAGMVAPQSLSFYLDPAQLFPPLDKNSPTRIAITPDYSFLSSVLSHWSQEEKIPREFWVPEDPASLNGLGKFPFPQRLTDPAYLLQFQYLVRVIAPAGVPRPLESGPDLFKKFQQLWNTHRRYFPFWAERRLPNGYRLIIYRRGP